MPVRAAVVGTIALVVLAFATAAFGAGDATRGSTLYRTTYACTDCHSATPDAGQIANGSTADNLLLVIKSIQPMRSRYLTTLGQNQTDLDDVAAYIASYGAPMASGPDLNQHGLTGSWFRSATNGQGIELEVFPNLIAAGTSLVQGAWFTFDVAPAGDAEHERWYTFNGNGKSGAANVPVTIYQNVGGNFDAAPVTQAVAVGTGTLSFQDCSNATLTYNFTDGSMRSGAIALTRVTPNVTCVMSGTPPLSADFALSGNWFDNATAGQGFVFDVNPAAPAFFLTWYTYALAGQPLGPAGQRWFVGLASPYTVGSRSIMLTLFETTGGVFDTPTNPPPSSPQVGTATVTFASCTAAQLQFNFTAGSSAGRAGVIALQRIGPVPPGCSS